MTSRYPIAEYLIQTCTFLDLDHRRVLHRAGLPGDWLEQTNSQVTGPALFRLWGAIESEANNPDAAFDLAQSYAKGTFVPAVLAFSCADNVYVGWQRLAMFKPLLAPIEMHVGRDATSVWLDLVSTVPEVAMPATFERFELTYLVECVRTYTGRGVVPKALEVRHPIAASTRLASYFQVTPHLGDRTRLVLHAEDGDLPLISRSPMLWDTLEPGLTEQLEQRNAPLDMSLRVRRVLHEGLPGGCTTAEAAARRLGVSKRSLQRRLTEEDTSFQFLLNDVRSQLAKQYLKQSDLSTAEICHLLGFREMSSFYRAFRGWTGTTPNMFRVDWEKVPG